jgi:hypothetical protein
MYTTILPLLCFRTKRKSYLQKKMIMRKSDTTKNLQTTGSITDY